MTIITYLLIAAGVTIAYVLGRWSRDGEVAAIRVVNDIRLDIIEEQASTIAELEDTLRPFAAQEFDQGDLDRAKGVYDEIFVSEEGE